MSTPVTSDQALEALRALHGVSLIRDEKDGWPLDRLPNGSYGFSYAPADECPLFCYSRFQIFEVHKAADGTEYIIGYVDEATERQLKLKLALTEFKLYPAPYEGATIPFALNRARIVKKRALSRIDGNFLPVTVSAA
jgi:hypothetical protein